MRRFAIGAVLLFAACSLPNVGLWSGNGHADTGLYHLYGSRIVHGELPYRSGFSMEFPPGAIPALAVPALPGSHYVVWFHLFQFGCALAILGALAYLELPLWAAALAPAALGPITLNAFDLWPAALAAWAVALTLRGRATWGMALLGAATAAKIYPVLLAPVLLTLAWSRRATIAGVVVLAAILLPFATLAPGGLAYSLREQATRGLQVESLGGSFLGAFGGHVEVSHAPFSFDIGGRGATVVGVLTTLVMLVAVAYAWRRRSIAATVVGFVAFAKVLSPQYLLFLVPFVAPAAPLSLLAVLGLTQVWARFPQPFLHTVAHLGPLIWVVVLRNLALVFLYARFVRRRSGQAVRNPRPFRPIE